MDTVEKDLKTFHKLHPNKKLTIIGIFVFVFIVSIAAGMILKGRGGTTPTGDESTAPKEGTVAGKSVLSMKADADTVTVGEPFTVTVSIDEYPVQVSDIFVNFDPELFKASDLKNGSVYETVVVSEITEEDGVGIISFTGASQNDTKLGDICSFTLTPLKKGEGTLSFDTQPKRTTTAKNGVNMLGTAEPITLTIK